VNGGGRRKERGGGGSCRGKKAEKKATAACRNDVIIKSAFADNVSAFAELVLEGGPCVSLTGPNGVVGRVDVRMGYAAACGVDSCRCNPKG
jgi:hypothetical protein